MSDVFLLGAATAAHQVEGNNIYSDCWALEQMEGSMYKEPSLDAVDHYNRYEQDIQLMADAGLNAYRFSIEWARIEPEQGSYDEKEIMHYQNVLKYCLEHGITPIVTMHHFSSPKWLIQKGGWENKDTIKYFTAYCQFVVQKLGDLMEYVCTINEANMGLQIAAIARDLMLQMGIKPQVGINFELPEEFQKIRNQEAAVFGLNQGEAVNTFLSLRTEQGDLLIMQAHESARDAMKKICPHLKIGVTLSLYDLQVEAGGEEAAEKEWAEQFTHYLPYMQKDDFIGVQNYTRKIIGKDGSMPVPTGAETTQMGYEFYPEAISNVIREVWKSIQLPIIVTENGVATEDDSRRVVFIEKALKGLKACIDEGIPVYGYLYWSLLDNFEWQEGFSKQFGLIAVDRSDQRRIPKKSLESLGTFNKQWKN
jgi:beta-glucosidase